MPSWLYALIVTVAIILSLGAFIGVCVVIARYWPYGFLFFIAGGLYLIVWDDCK